VYIPSYKIFVTIMGLVVLAAVWALLRYTRIGLIVRAGVENPTMVGALGINVGLVFLGVFSLGSALAALGGAVYTPYVQGPTVNMGQDILLTAIIVVVLGGLGSFPGSALGALIIGLAQNYVPFYTPQLEAQSWWPAALQNIDASASSLISLVILIVILLVRPQGLMGIKTAGGVL
ncbi:MAG: branched-chain amino acid ABC transporter permease, partial [Chloroflexota bacterium]|nr:branched-chain amino acid ABC transporter permease [Chloroflexota bacterium]